MSKHLTELRTLEQTGYQPNAVIAEQLSQRSLVMLIGPFAVGKSTCMETARQLDDDFGRCQSFTTRSRRPGEAASEYRFLPHNERVLARLAEQATAGELVQYNVHATTGNIYGSDLSDYQKPITMLDILSYGVDTMRALPFKQRTEIGLVAEPTAWLKRVKNRNMNASEHAKRMAEAQSSLEWLLDQGDAVSWLSTSNAKPVTTARELIGIVKGDVEPNPQARKIGERMYILIKNS